MVHVRQNQLLLGADKTMSVEQAVMTVGLDQRDRLTRIRERFGEPGVFGASMMIYNSRRDAAPFLDFIQRELSVPSSATPQATSLVTDNATLRSSPAVDELNLHLLHPSLSRKIYQPGKREGQVVWGLGRPRMLISHPFRSAEGSVLEMVRATEPIARSLMDAGYVGSYLFLDYLRGLRHTFGRHPGWLIWYAIAAAHSDVVFFVRERGGEFSQSQRLEIAFTPERVQKKVIELPPGSLSTDLYTWMDGDHMLFFGGAGVDSAALEAKEAEFSLTLVKSYTDGRIPRDRLVRLDEDGRPTQFAPDHDVYAI